jgi:histidine triad (HIT) family protein
VDDCVFCKIVKGEIPSKKVYESKDVMAFYDINPVAPVHVLIIPKKHIENLANVSGEDERVLGKCQLAAGEVAKKLGIADAFRLLTASGTGAGQTIFHLHYHLVGGWKDKVPKMEIW